MSPTETDLETRLRADLRARQDEAPHAPADLADLVRRRHRGQRRTQALTLVAAAAVVAVVAGASSLVSPTPAPDRTDTAESPSSAPAEPTILERPTRGSLADDAEWLAGIRRADWQIPAELFGELPDPPANERHVVFAGDVPGGRVALVVGQEDGRIGAAWFTGPSGAGPSDMVLAATPQLANRHAPLALLQTAGQHARGGVLVVVTDPGESVDLTAPPVVSADGTETRERVELPVVDGVVATRVEGAWSMGRQLRTRDGSARPFVVPLTLAYPDQPDPTAPREPRAGALSDEALFDDLTTEVLADYDLTAEEARPTVLARGTVFQGERVLLLGMTFPSGATGAWLLMADQFGSGWSGGLDRLPHAPAGTALEERVVAVPVNGYHLALHGPAGAVRAEVLTEDGDLLGSVELTDGGFVGEVPGGSFAPSTDGAASVRLLDAAGEIVAEGPIGRVVVE